MTNMPAIKNFLESNGCRKACQLTVQYAVQEIDIPDRQLFLKWTKAALSRSAEITIRIVDLLEGAELNSRFRQKPSATNVLTFVYDDNDDRLAGDIVLCAPVIVREAQQQGKSLFAHYAHLTVHGILHLQGYDHVQDEDAVVMESLETEIVIKLGYTDPYII